MSFDKAVSIQIESIVLDENTSFVAIPNCFNDEKFKTSIVGKNERAVAQNSERLRTETIIFFGNFSCN